MSNDFTRMAKRIQQLPASIRSLVDMELGKEMRKTKLAVQRELLKGNNHSSGALLQSIEHKDSSAEVSGVPSIKVDGYATHMVRAGGVQAPYAPYVEYGTGLRQGPVTPNEGTQFPAPSDPPITSIKQWMMKKGVIPETGDLEQSAILIAQDITNWGNHAHPYMRPAWKKNRPNYTSAHARGVNKALRRL